MLSNSNVGGGGGGFPNQQQQPHKYGMINTVVYQYPQQTQFMGMTTSTAPPLVYGSFHQSYTTPVVSTFPITGQNPPPILPTAQQGIPSQPSTVTKSSSSIPSKRVSTSPSVKKPSDPKNEIPHVSCFCTNWKKCDETKKEEHRAHYRHLCTSKNCTNTNPVHCGRFIHICPLSEECTKMSDTKHTHEFIHPCRYGEKCSYLNDPLHRIRFTHDALVKAASSSNSTTMDWPSEWKTSPPSTKPAIGGKYKRCFSLPSSSKEYQYIENKFLKSVAHSNSTAKVIKIQRLENESKWVDYLQSKYMISQKRRGNVNEKILYHGHDESTINIIMDQGFDFRMCSTGFYGQGTYFAVNASYSNGYATSNSTGERRILMCRVVTGEPMEVKQKNSTLTRPFDPTTNKMYDCVKGNPNGTEYVIFDNKQSYAEYCIIYK